MPRRQNPHMHLLEALLAAHDAFGDGVFFARAEELVLIFLSRFFQAGEGALPEYFDAALAPQREAGRFLVEPGHHYEWIWLLDRYAQRAAAMGRPVRPDLRRVSDALFEFADRFAVDSVTVSWSTACGATVNSGMAAFGCGLKPSGSRRKCGARTRRRTIWGARSSPLASTSKVFARGFGSNGWMPADMPVDMAAEIRSGHKPVSSHGSADRSRGRGARRVARNCRGLSQWNLP
jgi:hypothetical protein